MTIGTAMFVAATTQGRASRDDNSTAMLFPPRRNLLILFNFVDFVTLNNGKDIRKFVILSQPFALFFVDFLS